MRQQQRNKPSQRVVFQAEPSLPSNFERKGPTHLRMCMSGLQRPVADVTQRNRCLDPLGVGTLVRRVFEAGRWSERPSKKGVWDFGLRYLSILGSTSISGSSFGQKPGDNIRLFRRSYCGGLMFTAAAGSSCIARIVSSGSHRITIVPTVHHHSPLLKRSFVALAYIAGHECLWSRILVRL